MGPKLTPLCRILNELNKMVAFRWKPRMVETVTVDINTLNCGYFLNSLTINFNEYSSLGFFIR